MHLGLGGAPASPSLGTALPRLVTARVLVDEVLVFAHPLSVASVARRFSTDKNPFLCSKKHCEIENRSLKLYRRFEFPLQYSLRLLGLASAIGRRIQAPLFPATYHLAFVGTVRSSSGSKQNLRPVPQKSRQLSYS